MKGLKASMLIAILFLLPISAFAQWEVVRGNWTIQDDILTQTITDWQQGYQTVKSTSDYSDFSATATVEVLSSPGRERMVALIMRGNFTGTGSSGFEGYYLRVYCGWTSGNDFLELRRISGGEDVALASVSTSYLQTNTQYCMKVSAYSNQLYGKVWQVGQSEPGWQVQATDNTFSTGRFGLATYDASARFSDIQVGISYLSSYSLLSPLDDSIKSPVTFRWQEAIDTDPNDTVRYDLYLSKSVVFAPESTIVYDSLPDTTFTDSLDLKTWYWKVRSYDKWGATRWSDQSWSFYVYLCGDCNGDGLITVADVVYAINYLFKGGPVLKPLISGDVNCDSKVTIADVVYTISYLFKGGPKPCQNCP